jgi:hypothetical protein
MGRLIFKVLVTFFIEFGPEMLNRFGASVRWIYLRNEHGFDEIRNMEGNVGIALSIVIPIALAAFILISRQ